MAQNQKYQNWYNSYEGKKEGWFMKWYHSYNGKKIVNIVYSAGASVVIVGALFKILHWPFASQILMLGMFTEAFLFLIGVLEAPHEEFHWANVFPELLEYGSPLERVERAQEELGEGRGMSIGGGSNGSQTPQQNVPVLEDKEMTALKNGIAGLATTATQLTELGKIATSSAKLSEKMDAASEKMDMVGEATSKYAAGMETLTRKQNDLTNSYTTVNDEMQKAVNGTKEYGKNVEAVGGKLSEMVAVYTLQLNALHTQADAYKAQTTEIENASKKVQAMSDEMQKVQNAMADAAKNATLYEDGAKKLAGQVADLNKIYGNMLNALA